jgi:hypothetical protein
MLLALLKGIAPSQVGTSVRAADRSRYLILIQTIHKILHPEIELLTINPHCGCGDRETKSTGKFNFIIRLIGTYTWY